MEAVHGDFFNVVGFPLNRFCRELARLYRPPGPPEPSGPAQQDSMPRGDPAPGPPCAAASVRVSPGEGDPSPRGPEGAPRRDPRDAQPSCPADLLRIIHSFKASQVPGGRQIRKGGVGRMLVQWQPVCVLRHSDGAGLPGHRPGG